MMAGYNQPTFVIYLGFNEPTAFEIFYKVVNHTTPTRKNLMDSVKTQVNSVNSSSTHNWASVGSLLANSVMKDMGLIESVKEEVNKLYEAFQRSPLVFQGNYSVDTHWHPILLH